VGFSVSREQQKLFIDQFMKQVLDASLQLVDQGRDFGSPGATIYEVGQAVIRQIYRLDTDNAESVPDDAGLTGGGGGPQDD